MSSTTSTLSTITWNGYRYVIGGNDTKIITCIPEDIIKVTLNDTPLVFDIAPVNKNGRVLVPLRTIFESLGAVVTWNESDKTVKATKDKTTILLEIDSTNSYVNNQLLTLDVPATIVNGRTMVPVRFIAESLGTEVTWDSIIKTVVISDKVQ